MPFEPAFGTEWSVGVLDSQHGAAAASGLRLSFCFLTSGLLAIAFLSSEKVLS